MKLSDHSKARLRATFGHWNVDLDYSGPMYEYLINGFEPGSFFTALLANDFMSAAQHSHPVNTIPSLKKLAGWITEHMPEQAWGSYDHVKSWIAMADHKRREILEQHQLIYTTKEEVMLILKDVHVIHTDEFLRMENC
jgi:hypothetical protein